MIDTKQNLNIFQRTKRSLLSFTLLNDLFYAFFGLMPFILRKDLFASTLQISLFTMLKPSVAVLSFYWSSRIIRTKKSLRYNLVVAGILARVPFLFFPFFESINYMIFASAIYMLFSRAAIPAWMEILKLNLDKKKRERLFSIGSILGYTEGVIIVLFIGFAMDRYEMAWKFIFIITTLFGFLGVYIQWKTPIYSENFKNEPLNKSFLGFIKPWKESFLLLKRRRDFARYQIGTFIAMFGFMMATPAFYLFYADNLKLTHTDMAMGRYIFMGMGFVTFASLWARAMQKFSINFLTGCVCIGFALFPIFLILALVSKLWVFIAFLSYGITQAGSHLIWNLSGPSFANSEDSSKYTRINVLMIGVRGLIAPLVGGWLCESFSPFFVFSLSILFCSVGSFYMFGKRAFVLEKGLD